MSPLPRVPGRTAATAAGVAAAGFAVAGTVALLDPQSSESASVGVEHLGLAGFAIAALALAVVLLHLGRRAGAPLVGLAAAAGSAGLAVLGVVSDPLGDGPSVLDSLAAPASPIWLAGTAPLAVLLHRRGVATLPVAASLPFSYALAIPLAAVGGGLAAAGYWLAAARLLLDDDERLGARPALASTLGGAGAPPGVPAGR